MSSGPAHPCLAAVIDVAMWPLAHLRPRVVGAASGRVLELGCGTGLNFAHYRAPVTEVVGVEPDPYMLRRAEPRARAAPVPVRLIAGDVAAVPEGPLFDTLVLTFVLCTIPDPRAALRQAASLLAPDGRVVWVEHHAASCRAGRAAQGAIEPAWKWAAGGCHLTREPAALLADAGFIVEEDVPCGGQCGLVPVSRGTGRVARVTASAGDGLGPDDPGA